MTSIFILSLLLGISSVHTKPLLYEEPSVFRENFNRDPLLASPSNTLYLLRRNNYDMIMPPNIYDHYPTAGMPYQNFEKFYDPEMPANVEMNMDETQFVHSLPVREPQPLSEEERRIRRKLEVVDDKNEKKLLKKLKKGSTKPRGPDYPMWDQFDYDAYSSFPGNKREYTDG